MNTASYTVIEHLDPEGHVPGGIDSIIHGLVEFGPPGDVRIVGITKNSTRTLGQWVKVRYGGRNVDFLPVALLDRSVSREGGFRIPHSMQFIWGILKYRRQVSGATYHTHRVETGLACRILLGGELVQFVHNDASGLLGPNSDSTWKNIPWLYHVIERLVYKSASVVVLFNKPDAIRVEKLARRLISSRTWFDPTVFEVGVDAETPKSDGTEFNVAWVGRYESQKDPLLAIRVIGILRDKGIRIRLRMVGSGSLFAEMRLMLSELHLEDYVHFAGPLKRSEVARVMAESDALLMTSHYEGSPVVLAEANAVGTPVVATRESDPDGAVTNGTNGFCVDGRSAEQLADVVIRASTLSRVSCRRAALERSGDVAVPRLWEEISRRTS